MGERERSKLEKEKVLCQETACLQAQKWESMVCMREWRLACLCRRLWKWMREVRGGPQRWPYKPGSKVWDWSWEQRHSEKAERWTDLTFTKADLAEMRSRGWRRVRLPHKEATFCERAQEEKWKVGAREDRSRRCIQLEHAELGIDGILSGYVPTTKGRQLRSSGQSHLGWR